MIAPTLNCPHCGKTVAVKVRGEYTNILGVRRVSVGCPSCHTYWNENYEDIYTKGDSREHA